jgi:ATP-dependent Clp protease protease subunit
MPQLYTPSATATAPQDLNTRLLNGRIVFLGTQVDSEVSNAICTQMLLLEAADPTRDITFFINSPGGSVIDGLAIYDTMQYVACDVRTVAIGMAASMGQFLLCAGAPGKRYALPHAQILMHQPSGGAQGQATDISIHLRHTLELKRSLAATIAQHTGQPLERIVADSERDRWFSAQEALEYGFVDEIITRSPLAVDLSN